MSDRDPSTSTPPAFLTAFGPMGEAIAGIDWSASSIGEPAGWPTAIKILLTTKPMDQGAGLGLSMVSGFVRQSGGQVRICSEPGQGTTLCMSFPRHVGDAGPAEAEPGDESIAAGIGQGCW